MPRVNRDLQRRMAARRERERRRVPAERRYRFGAPADEEALLNGEEESVAVSPEPTASPALANSRAAHMPFSAYRAEYAYVVSDLRRVGLVIGSLLVILILLYFVLVR